VLQFSINVVKPAVLLLLPSQTGTVFKFNLLFGNHNNYEWQ